MNREQEVIKLIAEFLDLEVSAVTLESDLKEDLGADSLDFAELLMEMEEAFDFEADDSKVDIKTVKDVVDFINSTKE